MTSSPAIEVTGLSHAYRDRQALSDFSLNVNSGEVFAFLGPNGGGKTTLFRVLSTLIPIQTGSARLLGLDLRQDAFRIRQRLGVVFQAPSLDKKLTVRENIRHQAALYGLTNPTLQARETEVLERLRLTDRANERTETLSGGLRRRVELAKGLIHRPQLLLLDEPSTGLDPGARSDLWEFLQQLRDEFQMTVALTTHLLEEADKADRIAILDAGKLVALGSPNELRSTIGGDSITIQSSDAKGLLEAIRQKFGASGSIVDNCVRLEVTAGHQWIPKLVEAFPAGIASITLGKPMLEDVFIAKTGHRFMRSRDGGDG